MTSATALLEMSGIRKRFGQVEVLHGVDFRLEAGSVHALVGHNGAGKSTLIKVLAGLYGDSDGEVRLDGSPIKLDSPSASIAAGIAVIQQEFSLVPTFDAGQNLDLGQEPKRAPGLVDHRQMRKDGREYLESLGFPVPADVPVGQLSVAHQQMVEIAKALRKQARVLIMDEPTARLAPPERARLFAAIRKLASEGVGVIYISHFLDEVLEIADTVTVMRDGAVVTTQASKNFTVADLSTAMLGSEHHKSERFLDSAGADAAERLQLDNFALAGSVSVNLTLRAGEVLGIAGLVGSGRTELLEAIAGARPCEGDLVLDGQRIRGGFDNPADAMDAGVVLVPEDRKQRGLLLGRSVAENAVLSMIPRMLGKLGLVRQKARRDRVAESVRRFGVIVSDTELPISSLSGGNQQKVLFARAEGVTPKVLLLDQPTAGVDIGAKRELYGLIAEMVAEGMAVIVTSDELEELLLLSHRIAVLHAGAGIAEVRSADEFDEQSLLAAISTAGEMAE